MTAELAKAVLREIQLTAQAQIFDGNTKSLFEVQSITLDLTTARTIGDPYKIGFPFKSVYVSTATDTTVGLTMRAQTADSYQSGFTLGLKDSCDFDQIQSQAFLTWSAQSGKTITLVFFVNAGFRSGSQVQNSTGGVSINDGSSFTRTVATVAVATATSILAQDSTRKISSIQNLTGATLYVGDATITSSGATIGYAVDPGATFQWRNTAQLYAYSVLGGSILLLTES